ncbi:hypothetical protein EMIT0P4_250027 [Pseudomonas sp. IT-P4]
MRGFRLAFRPCKGILQARLRPHYREVLRAVVRRNGSRIGRRGPFFGWSEGLQGFEGRWRGKIFFPDFLPRIIFVQEITKKGFFHYILCFGGVFSGSRHN